MIVDSNKYKGVVISAKANYLYVDIDKSSQSLSVDDDHDSENIRLLCTQRSKLKYQGLFVSVGDQVTVQNVDWKEKTAVIYQVQIRKSFIERPPVANVTNLIILLSLSQPSFDFDQANRFLITAEKANLDVCLVLTKSDLVSKDLIKEYINKLNDWGYDPFIISTKTCEGIDSLLSKMHTFKLSVLCGPSGVGKSSLINLLLPNQTLLTSSVSKKLKRGRHTTRNVELFSLSDGCFVADTPGFNRPDLKIDPFQLPFLFPELRSQLELKGHSCKFRNCLHRDEPGCVVDKNWQRYSFYRYCIEEMISLHHQFQAD